MKFFLGIILIGYFVAVSCYTAVKETNTGYLRKIFNSVSSLFQKDDQSEQEKNCIEQLQINLTFVGVIHTYEFNKCVRDNYDQDLTHAERKIVLTDDLKRTLEESYAGCINLELDQAYHCLNKQIQKYEEIIKSVNTLTIPYSTNRKQTEANIAENISNCRREVNRKAGIILEEISQNLNKCIISKSV